MDAYTDSLAAQSMTLLVDLFIALLGLGILAVIVIFIIDVTQSTHTIRRNYPVIGRFRYWFEHLGEFFRQYFFAMDREELPFNRAERGWAYRASKNVDRNLSFGSTRDLTPTGTVMFMNSAFPTLANDVAQASPITIGSGCRTPYTTRSIFNISAMSYGALSEPAISALAQGAKDAQCWMNTGEGGVSPFHLASGCDLVFQIGTAKYGVRTQDGQLSEPKLKEVAKHPQVRMFEIKLSQGAKPGKGGILPASKVSAEIAAIRNIPESQASISPNGHPDIRSAADLLDMIERVRTITGKPVGFKAVIGDQQWLLDLLRLINKRGPNSAPDFITVDSADGGSGAAPQPLLDYVGLPLKESLPWLCDQLEAFNLRQRVKVIASGKLITPSKVAWALAVGADFVVSARGFMFALGCIQALQCSKNTCPTGITTHNKKLQRGLVPSNKAARVAHYQRNMSYGVGLITHSCGVLEPRQLRRKHVRIVMENGLSIPLEELHPPLSMTKT